MSPGPYTTSGAFRISDSLDVDPRFEDPVRLPEQSSRDDRHGGEHDGSTAPRGPVGRQLVRATGDVAWVERSDDRELPAGRSHRHAVVTAQAVSRVREPSATAPAPASRKPAIDDHRLRPGYTGASARSRRQCPAVRAERGSR